MNEINIGILVNTHGLRGEVKVKPTTDLSISVLRKENIFIFNISNSFLMSAWSMQNGRNSC